MSPTHFFWLVSGLVLPDVFFPSFHDNEMEPLYPWYEKKKEKKGFEKLLGFFGRLGWVFFLRSAISLTS